MIRYGKIVNFIEEIFLSFEKPYKISISMEAAPFIGTESKSVEELMSEADQLLYEQKRVKKKKLSGVQ